MSKIICDICGTVYPESSENCPVCGCSRDFGLDSYAEEFLLEESAVQQVSKKKNREIFDFDEVNQDDELEESAQQYDEEDNEEASRSNTGLVVVLIILIVLLLLHVRRHSTTRRSSASGRRTTRKLCHQ